ncbi:PTS mannose transporter subunit IIA [Orrella sp. JC864]|uniref:PTS sugar transporter subunit IIA n=1 Tax=Orrella sp. JC864 TaxID=3120298 RepID=UPI0012BBB8E3
MIGVVLVAHAPLGQALSRCVDHVMGPGVALQVCDIEADQDTEADIVRVLRHIRAADQGGGVAILADMLGATPANIATEAMRRARAEGLQCCMATGMNLPMVLRTINYRKQPLADVLSSALVGASQAVLRVD